MGLVPGTSKVNLPNSRVLYTVLQSPHIDKKSREQFQMMVKKQYLVMKRGSRDLEKKFFWLKRQCILGAQCEDRFFIDCLSLKLFFWRKSSFLHQLPQLETVLLEWLTGHGHGPTDKKK